MKSFTYALLISLVCLISGCNSSTEPKDCAGVSGGDAFIDDCGVCISEESGLAENYLMDCAGVCAGTSSLDNCGNCDDDPSDDCSEDCYGEWGGIAYIDDCNNCVQGTTGFEENWAIDCNGTCFGGAFLNECGCVSGSSDLEEDYCYGCTDVVAINFDNSLIDNGSCVYDGVMDIEGNIYTTVIIGSQEWMAENLRVTQYRNGNSIPNVVEVSEWSLLNSGGYCYLNNDSLNIDVYGNFYNWGAVIDENEICPEDWHIPSDDEWQILVDYLGGDDIAGGSLKSTGSIENGDGLWFEPNVGATNESGFTSLPAGYRYFDGLYYLEGEGSYFWSSTERFNRGMAWGRTLINTYTWVSHYSFGYPGNGASIRCVRD